MSEDHDVLVTGGGQAGMAAGSSLRRTARDTVASVAGFLA